MLLLYSISLQSQVVWSDDFSSGTGWTLNQDGTIIISGSTPSNGTDPNSWVINNNYNITQGPYPESTTIGGSGGNHLHVTCTNLFCTALFGAPGPIFMGGDPNTNTNRTALLSTAIPGATLTGGPFTLSFNWLCKGEAVGPNPGVGAKLIYSINGGAWQEYSTVFKGQSTWQTFSIPLATLGHASGQSLRIGFRWFNDDNADVDDPPMMVDDIKITAVPATNTITTTSVSSTVLCQGEIFTVNFTSTGTFNAGNVYSVELSDATGSFASPTVIGTLTSTANSGTITCTVPGGATPGTGYRVRVVSSNPAVIGSNNGVNITINPVYSPSVTISASPGTTICAGQTVNFSASITGLPFAPTYQWQINTGMGFTNIAGATSSTYSTSSLNNGDVIRLRITYSGPCNSGSTFSNQLTFTITSSVTPSVSITASSNPICSGQSVTFTATPTNGGSSPTYQWQLNGVNIPGATASTYTTTTLNNGDQINVVMTSNASCASPATVNSNTITMTVNPNVTPSVSITASSNPICSGQSVTFTATPTNGGSSPTYQWQLNGVNIPGATGSTYTTTTLNNGDQINVVMTSNAACASPATVNSNTITMTVNPNVTPSVSITASSNPICSGQSVTFTATPTNGGSSPTYQWQLNGVNIPGATGSTYTTNSLSNGDQIRVIMTSNASCASPTTATSSAITMTVNPNVTPSVSITASSNPICSGQSVTFTATPTNGGSSPTYQWQLNGVNIPGATGSTYTTSSLSNGDQIRVIMTSNASCASPTTATSSAITMTVNPNVTPSVSITASSNPICSGQSVTFTATPTNGGSSPTYQWQLNGVNIPGATGSTYTTSSLSNGDQIRVIMTSNAACASPATVNSNTVTMTVQSPMVVSPNVAFSPGSTICAGQTVSFTEVNNYSNATYQWNINGNPVGGANSNTFSSSTLNNGDQVTVTITPNCGSAVTSTPVTITVNPSNSASVSISVNPGTTICLGTSVTFTATPTNGGASPSYSWTVNGNSVGSNSPTYTTNTLQNGDVVQVTMQSSIPCSNPVSSQVTMTVNNPLPASVSITASTGTTICAGQSVTFTATPTNGGSNPTYQWQLNGVNIPGATSSTYTTTTLNNNDVINVVMTSSLSCVSGSPAFSNNIQFTVNTPVTPGVVISANPNTAVCQGTNVTFTATPSNVTNPPTYQWYINGNPVSGATSSTFSTTTLNNGDVVTVELTSTDACVTQSTVTSNAITAQINTPLPVSVNIVANNTAVCSGTDVQFTANVNNGGTPTYQWQVNGVNQGTNNPVFTYTPSNGDVVTCIVTSSLSCVSNNPATSNAVTITVHPNPTLSCSANDTTFGNPNTFVATATGANPITYVFDFGDGNQVTTTNNTVSHTYTSTGSYNYVITITDGNGCTATCNGSVNVTNPPVPIANFSTQNNVWAGCAPFTVDFVNLSQNATAYTWNFGDGSPTSVTTNPSHTFTTPGVYDMYLVASSTFGVDTAFATIIVYPNPVAGIKVLTTNPNIFEPTQFQDNSTGAAEWLWDFGDPNSGTNNISTDQNPSHQYTAGGTYTVKLVVTNAFGCKDSTSIQISISTVSNDKPHEIANLSVYPNPFSDKIEVRFYSNTTESVSMVLYDAIGKQVTRYNYQPQMGENLVQWNFEDFASGVYQLMIQQGEKVSTLRLVRTK
ncbi:MAG: hypothetical protein KatS3mg035_0352 [Bacteroidia bacterium]|nr:MAG: hypothetical protein KatS3mg035_0352 [Bacteroidia bacterium]